MLATISTGEKSSYRRFNPHIPIFTRKSDTSKETDHSVRQCNESEPSDLAPAGSNLNGANTLTDPDPFAGAIRFPSEEPDNNAGNENEEEGDEIDCEEASGWAVVSGPLSKEARAEAEKLGAFVAKESERIARKFKKSKREIILAAGLGLRSARSPNTFNMFKKWYAHHNPRQDNECEWHC